MNKMNNNKANLNYENKMNEGMEEMKELEALRSEMNELKEIIAGQQIVSEDDAPGYGYQPLTGEEGSKVLYHSCCRRFDTEHVYSAMAQHTHMVLHLHGCIHDHSHHSKYLLPA